MRVQRDSEAKLTLSIASPKLVIADHTTVSNAFRGAGVKLVEKLVSDAIADGFRVVPLRHFVNAPHANHPQWAEAFSV